MIDLVMWTKNGAKTLPMVLKRINQVIPPKSVGQRLIVDDASNDNTVQIAEAHGWRVLANEGSGISDGANTALNYVKTECFISFEQDLLLAKDWWRSLLHYLEDSKVAVASGMRFASKPNGVRELQKYVAKKYRGEKQLSSWLRSRKMASFTLGKTLDNTIYRTQVMREIGGFPKLKTNAGVDTILAYKIERAGYDWVVDYAVQSVHLRQGLKQELWHQYWYGTQLKAILREIQNVGAKPPVDRSSVFFRLLCSPLTAFFIALKTREPSTIYIHPLVKLYYTAGLLEAEK